MMNLVEQEFLDLFESFRAGRILQIPFWQVNQWTSKHMDYDYDVTYLDRHFTRVGDDLVIRVADREGVFGAPYVPLEKRESGTIYVPIRTELLTSDLELFFLECAGQGVTSQYSTNKRAIEIGIRQYWSEVDVYTLDAIANDLEQGLRESGLAPRHMTDEDKALIVDFATRCLNTLQKVEV